MSTADHGLMAELTSASAKLPNRTLFQLAMAGLRVRLARSAVTLLSIILAITYLSYSGINGALVRNLAMSDSDEVYILLREAKVNVEETREGSVMDRWLVIMALLTCTVGIANAMLMSVTERFREIGTMKCLGAENNTVVKLFLIESALLGLVGSTLGLVLGLVVSVVVGWAQFGRYAFQYFPGGQAVLYCVFSFATGIVLCLIGAGYPALVAAKMRPVEALRVEE